MKRLVSVYVPAFAGTTVYLEVDANMKDCDIIDLAYKEAKLEDCEAHDFDYEQMEDCEVTVERDL